MDLIEAQRERWSDPKTHTDAEARSNRVNLPKAKLESQRAAMYRAPKLTQRIFWLRQMADTFAAAVAPHSACRHGCSACCYQSVMVTEAEAKMIASETGAAYTEPPEWRGAEPAFEFTGQRCTFLGVDGRCTIYEHRPFACRVLFNMDADDLLCRISPEATAKVPYANAMPLNAAYVQAHVQQAQSLEDAAHALRWADLREFFPQGIP